MRERRGDIPDLVAYFLEYYNRKYNCRARTLSGDLMSSLQKYHWPGNIRELENLIKRYVILGNEEVISSDLVSHQQEYAIPDINYDGPIALKTMNFAQCMPEMPAMIPFSRIVHVDGPGFCARRSNVRPELPSSHFLCRTRREADRQLNLAVLCHRD